MNNKSIILCLVVIILNLSLTFSATTKKTTRLMRTTVKKTTKTTTESTKVSQCFQSFKGYYEDKFYNVSSPSACATNCFSYKESLGTETVESGTCNDETTCVGGIFVVKYNYTFIYDCCTSNLCNSQEYNKRKLNYKCEFQKQVPKSKKLIIPVRKLNAPSVNKCYICDSCTSASSAQIMDCSQRNSTIKNFACIVKLFLFKYWLN